MTYGERFVWAVVFGNYYPLEIDSLWTTEGGARAEAGRFNDDDEDGDWRVEKMRVRGSDTEQEGMIF